MQGGGMAQVLQKGCGKEHGHPSPWGSLGVYNEGWGGPRFKGSCTGYPEGLQCRGERSWEQEAWKSMGMPALQVLARRRAALTSSSSLATPVPHQHMGTLSAGLCEAAGRGQP